MTVNLCKLSRCWLQRRDLRLRYTAVRTLHGPPKPNEYTSKPLYPPIPQYRSENEKRVSVAKEAVKNMSTVEEKMYQINRPKYFGWYSYLIDPNYLPVDILDFSKFSTWTHVVDELPEYFTNKAVEDEANTILAEISPLLEQVLCNELSYHELGCTVSNDRAPYSERHVIADVLSTPQWKAEKTSVNLIRRIHEVISSHLYLTHQHVRDSAEDYSARNEAFWFRGGIAPDKEMLNKREGTKRLFKKLRERKGDLIKDCDEDAIINRPYERALQIKYSSVVQVRHKNPLSEFVSRDDPLCTTVNVPILDYDPRCYGFKTQCQHGTNIPGYWPEESNQMGLLSYHTRKNEYNVLAVGAKDVLNDEISRAQDISKGILTNFCWLLPQACHLGFSPLTELTFPLVSQSVNTDGRLWSYFTYQMNTCDVSTNDPTSHTHQNILWAPEPQSLYSKVENGKVLNFNPDCLKPLIKMYLNKPRRREYSLTPYLGEVGTITEFRDSYQRNRFMTIIRNQLSNRPKTMAKPEMYLWEKLLLVDNETMPQLGQTRRRRWWMMSEIDFLGKEHWNPEFVNTDEKRDRYIAKGMREEWTRKGQLNRRYNKFQPKIQIPLKDKIAVYEIPETKYKGEKDD